MLRVNHPHGVWGRVEAFRSSGVIDQGRLDALRGRDGEDAGNDAGTHAGKHVAERREGVGFGVFEGILDHVKGEKADAVFGDGADDQGEASFVQCPCALVAKDLGNDKEGIAWSGSVGLITELDSGLGKLKGIRRCGFDASGYTAGKEGYDWRSFGVIGSGFWTH